MFIVLIRMYICETKFKSNGNDLRKCINGN
jgi:hypothetical protein